MPVKNACSVCASLVALSCFGLVACGGNTVAGGDSPNDVPRVDVVSVDESPSDIAVDEAGGVDAAGTDAGQADASTADEDAAEVGGTDAGTMDVGGADVGAMDVSMGDGAGGTDGRADVALETGMDAVVLTDAPVCMGTHPLLDGGARFCGPGQCYCPSPGTNGDSCLPMGTAAACCPGRSVMCTSGADAGPTCPTGTHPLLDGGARFCGPGQCYCPTPGIAADSCLPAASAAACCPGRSVTCAGGDAGTTCPAGTHPLVDGGARFCASGSCYCPSSDACRPAAVARMCCPTAVICD